MHYNRARSRSSTDDCTDRRTFSAAKDRTKNGACPGSDPAAFNSFFRLTIAFGCSFGVYLYYLAVLVFDALEIAGKIVLLATSQGNSFKVKRYVRVAGHAARSANAS